MYCPPGLLVGSPRSLLFPVRLDRDLALPNPLHYGLHLVGQEYEQVSSVAISQNLPNMLDDVTW